MAHVVVAGGSAYFFKQTNDKWNNFDCRDNWLSKFVKIFNECTLNCYKKILKWKSKKNNGVPHVASWLRGKTMGNFPVWIQAEGFTVPTTEKILDWITTYIILLQYYSIHYILVGGKINPAKIYPIKAKMCKTFLPDWLWPSGLGSRPRPLSAGHTAAAWYPGHRHSSAAYTIIINQYSRVVVFFDFF